LVELPLVIKSNPPDYLRKDSTDHKQLNLIHYFQNLMNAAKAELFHRGTQPKIEMTLQPVK
tara:strand:- start:192 stop:374 length:183 start_codon:yes stop_codon:yes gene_type:complete